MTANFEKSKFYKYGKFLREVVEIGEPISDKDLDNMLEVINEMRNFALGYKDKILITWSSMAALPLESYKLNRSFDSKNRKKEKSNESVHLVDELKEDADLPMEDWEYIKKVVSASGWRDKQDIGSLHDDQYKRMANFLQPRKKA